MQFWCKANAALRAILLSRSPKSQYGLLSNRIAKVRHFPDTTMDLPPTCRGTFPLLHKAAKIYLYKILKNALYIRKKLYLCSVIVQYFMEKNVLPIVRLFDDNQIRIIWKEETEAFFFCVADVIVALTGTEKPNNYLKQLRYRDKELSKGWLQIVTPLSVETAGGPQKMNFATL